MHGGVMVFAPHGHRYGELFTCEKTLLCAAQQVETGEVLGNRFQGCCEW
jgi:hypothetical protein